MHSDRVSSQLLVLGLSIAVPKIPIVFFLILVTIIVSHARPYSQRVRFWGIWTGTCGKKECFNCLRNCVTRSLVWSVRTF